MTPRHAAAALAAVLALGAPRGALAQLPAAEDRERPTLLFGPVEVRPRLLVGNVGVDSNVFNEFEAPRRDFTATVAPDVEVAVNPWRLRLSALSGAEFVYFRKYASERSTNRTFGARAEADLNVLRPFVAYSASHTSQRLNEEIDVRARRHPRTVSGGTRVRLASTAALVLTAQRTVQTFDEAERFRGVELASTLNSTMTGYEGAFAMDVTPLTTLSLGVQHERTRFEAAPLRDSDSLRIAPSITISPLGLVTGTATVGYRRVTGRDARLPGYSGLSASGSLGMVLADRYRLETSFVRELRYSYETALPYYVQSGARLSAATYLFGGIDVRGSIGRDALAYRAFAGDTVPGRDQVTRFGAGVGVRVGERMQLVVTAERVRRSSQRDVRRGYDNDRVLAALNWGATTR